MTTPTDENRDLLTVVAYMRAADGKTEELRTALEALIEPTGKEQGYVNYDLHQGVEDPRFFTFYENWLSGEIDQPPAETLCFDRLVAASAGAGTS